MTRKKLRTTLTALSLLLLGLTAATAQEEIGQPIQDAQLVDTLPLDGEVFHVQGVDLDSRHVWVTSVDLAGHRGYLHQFDRRTGKVLRRLELTDGPRYHPGGFSLHGNSIWVAVAEMKPNSSATLEEIDAFYKKLTDKSWIIAPRMPGLQNGVLLTGYDSGNTALIVGAVDAKPLGGTGVIVYTAKGTK